MKFIHTADLHLGYKFSSEYSESTLSFLKENQRKTFSDIIDMGIHNKIDALLIAGDLFDIPNPKAELFDFVASEFKRGGFPVFIICGNHDPKTKDSVYEKKNFPENVHIFSEELSPVTVSGVNFYGSSFIAPHKLESSIKDFKVENENELNILLAHGDIAKEGYYNPMKPGSIKDTGADYVALGHIHMECDIKKEGTTYYGYSGAPYGSTFKETGDFFVILSEIEKGFLKYEKVDLSRYSFKELEIRLELPQSEEDIISIIRKEISAFDLNKTLFNIKLTGYINDGFSPDFKAISEKLNESLLYLRLTHSLTVKYDLELLKHEESVRGEFVRNALKELEGKDPDYILKVIEYGVSRL
ncbi:MAG: DNA repair exonuclease [Ruminococcaceae bacterium]|nr:DNA repair exonuclease [Oscillospiraceae bacterium]